MQNPVSVSFLDVYENGGLDFLVTYQNKDSKFHTKVYKNELVLENAFLKVSGRLYFTRDFLFHMVRHIYHQANKRFFSCRDIMSKIVSCLFVCLRNC